MINAHRGEAELAFGGRTYVLWFGWSGIAMLQAEFGRDDLEAAMADALAAKDLRALATMLAIAMRESRPGITADDIIAESPPITAAIDAVATCLRRTYQGMEVRDEPAPRPPNLMRRIVRAIRSWRLTGSLSMRA